MVDTVHTPPIFHHDLLSQYMLVTSQSPSITQPERAKKVILLKQKMVDGIWNTNHLAPALL